MPNKEISPEQKESYNKTTEQLHQAILNFSNVVKESFKSELEPKLVFELETIRQRLIIVSNQLAKINF